MLHIYYLGIEALVREGLVPQTEGVRRSNTMGVKRVADGAEIILRETQQFIDMFETQHNRLLIHSSQRIFLRPGSEGIHACFTVSDCLLTP